MDCKEQHGLSHAQDAALPPAASCLYDIPSMRLASVSFEASTSATSPWYLKGTRFHSPGCPQMQGSRTLCRLCTALPAGTWAAPTVCIARSCWSAPSSWRSQKGAACPWIWPPSRWCGTSVRSCRPFWRGSTSPCAYAMRWGACLLQKRTCLGVQGSALPDCFNALPGRSMGLPAYPI